MPFRSFVPRREVRVVRFHDPRHTLTTRLALSGAPIRAIRSFLSHADFKTTEIYAHCAPREHELAMVNDAFAPKDPRGGRFRPFAVPRPMTGTAPGLPGPLRR